MNNPEDFKWISQTVFEKFDEVNNVNLTINFESGLSEYPNQIQYTNPRVSFKFYQKATHNKIAIELTHKELNYLSMKLKDVINGKLPQLDIKTFSKNKVRFLKIKFVGPQSISIVGEDNTSIARAIGANINVLELDSIRILSEDMTTNYIQHSFNIINALNQQKIISDIKKIENRTVQKVIHKQHVPVISKEEKEDLQLNHDIDDNFDDDSDDDSSEDYKLENTYTDTTTDFDYDSDNFDTDTEEEETVEVEVETSFVINNEMLSDVELDGKKTNYTKPKKDVIIPRPIFNNFLDWDLTKMIEWVTAFSYTNRESDDLSLMPLELILTKSVDSSSFKTLKEHPKYYECQNHILSGLKSAINEYIQTETFRISKAPILDEAPSITKYSNKDLWNFVVDLIIISLIFHVLDARLSNLSVKDYPFLYDIKKTRYFLGLFNITFLDMIDDKDMTVFRDDVFDVVGTLFEKDTLKPFIDHFSEATKGGSLTIDLKTITSALDKYIDVSKREHVQNERYSNDEFDNGISSVEDIKARMPEMPKKQVEDGRVKLFYKMLKSFKIDHDNTFETWEEIESNLSDDEQIMEIFECIKENPEFTKISQVKRALSNEKVEEPTKVETDSSNKEDLEIDFNSAVSYEDASDIFSIPDEDDYNDLENLISGVN